ncbi:uncharacterized protein TNCV_1334411 [Trichonephila clavipes]|nr:uncharacterized protein TNCV_1334411 [Trichonephila clavipes]
MYLGKQCLMQSAVSKSLAMMGDVQKVGPKAFWKCKLDASTGLHTSLKGRKETRVLQAAQRISDMLGIFQKVRVAAIAEWYRYRTVACFVTGSSPVPLKTRRVGQRRTLNLSRAETSSRWCGVVVRRGGCQLRCRPRHLTMVQNYVVRRQKPSCS